MGYFYTICAVILDVICGLNYVPFQEKGAMLNEMVKKLDRTAKETGNHEYIYGQGKNGEEKKKNREFVYKSVKFFYIKPKGGQSAAANQLKESCDKILAEYMLSQPNDPFDVPYAERGHHSDSATVDVDAAAASKRPKLSKKNKKGDKPSTTEGRVIKGIFYKKFLRNEMPIRVFMQYENMIPQYLKPWYDEIVKMELKKQSQKESHTSNEYFQLPEYVAVITIKTDSDLEKMIKILEPKEVISVGVDTESYIFDHSLQLIQISTKKDCFLIRRKYVIQLNKDLLEKLGIVLSTKMIVFFSGSNDSEQLGKFIPNCELIDVLDLQKLLNKLGFTVYTTNNQKKPLVSLGDVVQEWMRKPFSKDMTLSNWSTDGELSHEQTMYAALDAWVLVPLLEAIKNDQRYKDSFDQALSESKFLSKTVDSIDATH